MIPDFVNGVQNTLSDGWNWITGNRRTNEPSVETGRSNDHSSSSSLDDISTVTPIPEPVKRHNSLVGELLALKTEAIDYATKKAKIAYEKLAQKQSANKQLTDLMAAITAQTERDGTLKIKKEDKVFKELLLGAKNQGVTLDTEKESYSKDEVGKLISQVELRSRNLETDLKLGINEVQESVHQRNLYFQEIKSLWDKFFEVIKKIINAIIPR